MKDKSSISQWQQANDLFESYQDKPIEESIIQIENDETISPDVKVLVLRLLKSLSSESTIIEQADLSYFDSLNEAKKDLSGTDIGDYHLICHIGEGGMAQVYKAERINTSIQKFVAVKVLSKKQKLNKSLENLFEEEQLTLSKLTHPNIISFHHGGLSADDTPYLVMEYIENAKSIALYCQKNKLGIETIINLLLPIIDAIGYAHQQLIVHKDIKPSNILIDAHGKPYLLDFGISSISNQKIKNVAPHIYTPDYASPEQFLKAKITTASDIFSFVAMLLDLITGKKRTTSITQSQYDYHNDEKDIEKILNESKLDNDLKNIIKKGLKEKPSQRYQSAQELKLDLKNWLKSEPVSATAQTGFYLFKKFVKRNPLSSLLVTVLFSAILFSLSAMFTQMNHAEREAKKSKQVTDFLIESIQSSDPDLTKGKDVTVKELLNNAKLKIQETSLDDIYLTSSLEQNIGAALAKVGQYKEAEKLLLQAISSNKNNFDARLNLAQLHLDQNNHKQSYQQYSYLTKHQTQLTRQQNTFLQQINAAQLCLKGDFEKAIDTISILINNKDANTKQDIKNHLILADILDKKGDSQKAVEVLEKTLQLSHEKIGQLSTTSTNISNLLADALTNINPVPYKKLMAIYQQTITSQIKLYGEKHPLVAKTYLQYGFALKATAQVGQAKDIANKARDIAIDNFGNKHILTAHIDLLLSQLELAENNTEKAITILKQVLRIYEDTYGLNHFETNQVKTTLALYMIKATQGQAAIRVLLPLYESQIQQLGQNHQATLYVVLNLLKAYNLVGDYQSAINIGKEALINSQKHLGKEFMITIGLQTILGESYIHTNNPAEAINLFTPLLQIDMVKQNSTYHKKIASLMIQAYYNNQQFILAKQLIQKITDKYYSDESQVDDFYRNLAKFKAQD